MLIVKVKCHRSLCHHRITVAQCHHEPNQIITSLIMYVIQVDINIKCIYAALRKYNWCNAVSATQRANIMVIKSDGLQVTSNVMKSALGGRDKSVRCLVHCYNHPDEI